MSQFKIEWVDSELETIPVCNKENCDCECNEIGETLDNGPSQDRHWIPHTRNWGHVSDQATRDESLTVIIINTNMTKTKPKFTVHAVQLAI